MEIPEMVDVQLGKLEKLRELSSQDILSRNMLIRMNKAIEIENEGLDNICKIESVIGFDNWESLINRSSDMISIFKKFSNFAINPRKINR